MKPIRRVFSSEKCSDLMSSFISEIKLISRKFRGDFFLLKFNGEWCGVSYLSRASVAWTSFHSATLFVYGFHAAYSFRVPLSVDLHSSWKRSWPRSLRNLPGTISCCLGEEMCRNKSICLFLTLWSHNQSCSIESSSQKACFLEFLLRFVVVAFLAGEIG